MFLDSVSPLPFHALSNLLTLFSHEVPTLPLIQHVWDFLLCREPLAVVWLAVAVSAQSLILSCFSSSTRLMSLAQVVLVRKPDVLKLAIEGEDGMIHSILNALPPLNEGFETKEDVPSDQHTRSGSLDEVGKAIISTREAGLFSIAADENARNESFIEEKKDMSEDGPSRDIANGQIWSDMAADDRNIHQLEHSRPAFSSAQPQATEESVVSNSSEAHFDNNADIVQPSRLPPLSPHAPSHSRSCTPATSTFPRASQSSCRTESRSPSFSAPRVNPTVAPISLPSLLTHAAQLLEAYPPTLPELCVKGILGLKSVVHTWIPPRKGFSLQSDNERDDEAESWVGGPDVVIPFVEDEDIEESETERKTKSRKGPATKRRIPFLPPRMRLRFGVLTPTEKRVLLVGAVVVVGLAIALRQSRGFPEMKRGWIAWVCAFIGGIRSRPVL